MTASRRVELISQASVGANITSIGKALDLKANQFVGLIKVSDYVGGDFDGKIQHSPNGSDWFDLATFATLSANGLEAIQIAVNIFPSVRGVLTTAAGPDATVEITLWHGEK